MTSATGRNGISSPFGRYICRRSRQVRPFGSCVCRRSRRIHTVNGCAYFVLPREHVPRQNRKISFNPFKTTANSFDSFGLFSPGSIIERAGLHQGETEYPLRMQPCQSCLSQSASAWPALPCTTQKSNQLHVLKLLPLVYTTLNCVASRHSAGERILLDSFCFRVSFLPGIYQRILLATSPPRRC